MAARDLDDLSRSDLLQIAERLLQERAALAALLKACRRYVRIIARVAFKPASARKLLASVNAAIAELERRP